MLSTKVVLRVFLCITMASFIFGCAHSKMLKTTPVGKVVYNRYNIHTYVDNGGDIIASYANFTDPGIGHKVYPPNTVFRIDQWSRGIKLIRVDTGEVVRYEFSPKRTRVLLTDYLELITSTAQVSLNDLTELDMKGVSEGKIYKGMTRKGVMVALGYPSPHRTPDINANHWVYWMNRFDTRTVVFDDKGLVISTGLAY